MRPEQRAFRHLVLTRFNVRGRYHTGDPGDDWLRGRLELFDRFTVPSFAVQTCRDFRWLLLCDAESRAWFSHEVELRGPWVFEPVWVSGACYASFAVLIVAAHADAPVVLSTRVDNDDAVAADFIATIQAEAAGPYPRFINLVDGAQLAGARFYRRPYTQNPFVTLAEDADSASPSSVFVKRHFEVAAHAPVDNVRTSHPMWLQVVHGGNVLTDIVGLRMPARSVAPWFGCDLPSADTPSDFARDFALGAARIAARLVRRPHRLLELGRAVAARAARPG